MIQCRKWKIVSIKTFRAFKYTFIIYFTSCRNLYSLWTFFFSILINKYKSILLTTCILIFTHSVRNIITSASYAFKVICKIPTIIQRRMIITSDILFIVFLTNESTCIPIKFLCTTIFFIIKIKSIITLITYRSILFWLAFNSITCWIYFTFICLKSLNTSSTVPVSSKGTTFIIS